MFHRLPTFQAPPWLIALLIGVGVALDVDRFCHNNPPSEHLNSGGNPHKQILEDGIRPSSAREGLVVDK